ncbi:hypothetical protein ABPG75_003006 [Micractinium tetrahymenae]
MSLGSARGVLLAAADEQLGLPAAGRLAVAALTSAASSGSAPPPEQLLDTLLHMHTARKDDGQHAGLLWVQAGGAVVLLRQLSAVPAAGQEPLSQEASAAAAVEQLLLPALASLSSDAVERQQALVAATAEITAAFACWGLAEHLVQAAAGSHQQQQPPSASAQGQQQQAQPLAGIQAAVGQLTPELRLGLATAVLQEALKALPCEAAQEAEQAPRFLLQHAAEHTLPAVLQLLAADQPRQAGSSKAKAQTHQAAAAAARSAARQLLAAALQAACAVQQQGPALQQLWATCRDLLAAAGYERQLGLALLVQFGGPLLPPAGGSGSGPPCPAAGQGQWVGLQGDAAFWALLRACLADGELANRKRAAHMLQLAVAGPDGQPVPGWRPLLKLLDCLEELAPHLVQDGWAEIDGLHPRATAAQADSDVLAGAAAGPGGSPGSWEWLAVVWSRGLSHQHHQVQRQVLSSFLNRRWHASSADEQRQLGVGSMCLTAVPQAFVLGTLLPAAGQAHMWRGEGAAELQQQMASWVGAYAAAQAGAGPQQAQQLLLGLLARLESGDSSGQQQRPLVQTLAAALQAASEAVAAAPERGTDAAWQLLFLQRLRQATSSLSGHWGSTNSSHARSTCRSLLAAAAATVVLLPAGGAAEGTGSSGSSGSSDVQLLAAAGAWLQELPLALLLPSGELHHPAAAWVGAGGWQRLLPLLAACIEAYMAGHAQVPKHHADETSSSSAPQVPIGWADWQRQAAGLACLALLLAFCAGDGAGRNRVARKTAAAQPSAADLAKTLVGCSRVLQVLYRRPYLSSSSAERCLLLIGALLSVGLPPATAAKSRPFLSGLEPVEQPAGWLAECLSVLLAAGADELASYAGMAAAASLWAAVPGQMQPGRLAGGAAEEQAPRRAQLALSCLCGSLQLLACQRGSLGRAVATGGQRLAAGCLEALCSFGQAQQGGQQAQAAGWNAARWQLAAAQLLPVADCCSALATAAEARWLDSPSQAAAGSAAGVALDGVLRLQAAALEAAAAAQAQGKAAMASGTPGALAAYSHRLCWKAAHALMLLLQLLQTRQQGQAGGTSSQPLPAQQPWEEQQAAVLAAALTSLQRSAALSALASDARGLLYQLRCCRLVLPGPLASAQVGQAALAQRQRGQQPHEQQQQVAASSGSANVELAGWLCQAAWLAYEGAAVATKRRRAGLTAAVVSACLHPQLFEPRAASAALHAPDGPVQRLLGGLLELGTKSWRIMSITSLQLFGLLSRHPELAPHYVPSLQQTLLWGTSEDPGQSGVGDAVDADSAAELAALIAPADAELAAAFAGSELAPRVAALCLLRCWVEQAGQQAQQAQQAQQRASPQGTADAAAGTGSGAAAREAGLLIWRRLLGLAASDPELSAARYSPLGHVHRKKVRVWQALCTLSQLVPDDQVEADFDALLAALDKPELSNVRQYIDTAALVLLRRRPTLLRSRVLPALRDCTTSGTHALSSLLILAARELVWQLRPAGAAQPSGSPEGSSGSGGSHGGGTQSGGSGQLAAHAPRHQKDEGEEVGSQAQADEELLGEVLAAITPWALSHVHALRTFSQLVLWRLYELFPWVPQKDATAAALLHFFTENNDVWRLRRGLSHTFLFDTFDLDRAVTPAGMLCTVRRVRGGRGRQRRDRQQTVQPALLCVRLARLPLLSWLSFPQGTSVLRADASFEGAPQPLMEAVQAFLSSERQSLRQDFRDSKAAATAAELAPAAQPGQLPPAGAGGGSNWQKKGGGAAVSAGIAGAAAGGGGPSGAAASGPWADALGSAALLGGGLDGTEAELAAAAEAAAAARGGPRQQLVVVASLLTKAPNLAGLARTCEVFRASCLVLGDMSVTRLKEFTSIAVTAHQWIPLAEVPEAALATWLQAQATAGWTLVGLEQTAESVQLQDFCFPDRTVLVLGREKEGIPPHILGLLHSTVEIPQLGLIRSLNVHVSGAICMWELTRQRLVKGGAVAGPAGGGNGGA